MKQKKIISLPTNPTKIYRQILAFMNFMLNLTPQERDVLAELIRLDNEYEALPQDKRAKFILSTDMRKEIREELNIEEKQFNVIISRLKKKMFFNKTILDDNNIIHPELKFKPDHDGFKIEVNLVMTAVQNKPIQDNTFVEEPVEEINTQEIETFTETIPTEYKHDASKAPVIEQEEFDFTISLPNE